MRNRFEIMASKPDGEGYYMQNWILEPGNELIVNVEGPITLQIKAPRIPEETPTQAETIKRLEGRLESAQEKCKELAIELGVEISVDDYDD